MKKLLNLFQATLLSVAVIMTSAMMPSTSHAALEIEISGGNAQQLPIAIVPFNQDNVKKSRKHC